MIKYWILLGTAFLTLNSCGDSKIVKEKEQSLLEDTIVKEPTIEEPKEEKAPIDVACLREGSLLKKPERWSKTNPSVKNGKFYFGSKALLLEEQKPKKRRYLKLRLNDGTEGWATDWLLIENAKPAVVTTKNIRLYKKADVVAFSDNKLILGNKIALGNNVIGGFKKIVYKTADNKSHTYWVKQNDTIHLSTDANDFLLAGYYEKLIHMTVAMDKLELIDEIEGNEEFSKSPFYKMILECRPGDEKPEELPLVPEIILDTVVVEDEF